MSERRRRCSVHRKVFSLGSSKGVSIPVDHLARVDLAAGAEVAVTLEEKHDHIVIEPVRNLGNAKMLMSPSSQGERSLWRQQCPADRGAAWRTRTS
jgi:antitoxin component of MazEF toxin-antitoxin module